MAQKVTIARRMVRARNLQDVVVSADSTPYNSVIRSRVLSRPSDLTVNHQTIVVLDFGSQFTQLIARRLRELSVYAEILPFDTPIEKIRERAPVGIILSGGPKSVSESGAPHCDTAVYAAGVPVLGICYGMQLMTHALGGHVAPAPHREFGLATIQIHPDAPLFASVPSSLRVWASHGDFVKTAPAGFAITATSANAPVAAMASPDRRLYALLFHPEVAHTDYGLEILRNFAYGVCGCTGDWTMKSFVDEATRDGSASRWVTDVWSAGSAAAWIRLSPRCSSIAPSATGSRASSSTTASCGRMKASRSSADSIA